MGPAEGAPLGLSPLSGLVGLAVVLPLVVVVLVVLVVVALRQSLVVGVVVMLVAMVVVVVVVVAVAASRPLPRGQPGQPLLEGSPSGSGQLSLHRTYHTLVWCDSRAHFFTLLD